MKAGERLTTDADGRYWVEELGDHGKPRLQRKRTLGDFAKFYLPTWDSAKVYETV